MSANVEKAAAGGEGSASMGRLRLWMRALRAPFFQAVIVPCVLGTAVAWYHTGEFHLGYFLVALAGVVCVNAGANLTNDYFDHESGADALNRQYTRFSGGSRVIQEGLIPPGRMRLAAVMFFALAALLGLYLVYARGWPILVIGVVGVASGYFYTGSPARIGYRGWGELLAGLNCGPLVVLGAYFVQARAFSGEALLVSVPVGLLIAAVLYINQFADYQSDKAANKANLVVRLGPERAIKGFGLLLTVTYLVVILGCGLGVMHWMGLASLLTIPLAWKAAKAARENHATGSGEKLLPAMSGTVATHLLTGLLLSCGYLAAGVLR
ncbi:MAG: 1,4-dihydroxy-2-naphthoate octaprenyltransferase [Planctomycetota bacterium]